MASNEYVWQEYSALKRRVFNQFGKCICLLAVCKQATQLDSLGLSIESSDICWLSQTSVQIFLEFPVLFSFSKNMSTSLIILVYTLRTLYVWKYPVYVGKSAQAPFELRLVEHVGILCHARSKLRINWLLLKFATGFDRLQDHHLHVQELAQTGKGAQKLLEHLILIYTIHLQASHLEG